MGHTSSRRSVPGRPRDRRHSCDRRVETAPAAGPRRRQCRPRAALPGGEQRRPAVTIGGGDAVAGLRHARDLAASQVTGAAAADGGRPSGSWPVTAGSGVRGDCSQLPARAVTEGRGCGTVRGTVRELAGRGGPMTAIRCRWHDAGVIGVPAPAATPPATPGAAPGVPAATWPSAPRSSCTQPVLRAVFSKVDTLAVFMAWFLPAPRDSSASRRRDIRLHCRYAGKASSPMGADLADLLACGRRSCR
jgi:hypothetical protein